MGACVLAIGASVLSALAAPVCDSPAFRLTTNPLVRAAAAAVVAAAAAATAAPAGAVADDVGDSTESIVGSGKQARRPNSSAVIVMVALRMFCLLRASVGTPALVLILDTAVPGTLYSVLCTGTGDCCRSSQGVQPQVATANSRRSLCMIGRRVEKFKFRQQQTAATNKIPVAAAEVGRLV